MSHRSRTDDEAARASSTLADVDRQITARLDGPGTAGSEDPGAVHWAELEDVVVARLAAGDVIATNRAIGQRSLRDFLR